MKNAETSLPSGKPLHKHLLFILQLLYPLLFLFPLLPLKAANIILILFIAGVLGVIIFYREPGFLPSLKANFFFILPFLPYLIEFIIFPQNSIARFALEKKLLLFIGPVIFPFFLAVSKKARQKTPLMVFTSAMLAISLYTLATLLFDGTLTGMNSYMNEAFILRTRFEAVSHLHPTYYSMFCVTAIMFLPTLFPSNSWPAKICGMLLILLLVIGVVVVASKSGLVILIICPVIYIARLHSKITRKVFLLSALIICGLILFMTFPSLKARLESILFPVKTESGSRTLNQRVIIFDCSVKTFSDHFFFGTGNRNSQAMLDKCYSTTKNKNLTVDTYNTHNQYLTIGINYGVVILLLFLFSLLKAGRYIIRNPSGLYFLISVLVVFLTETVLECQMGVYFFSLFTTYFYTVNKK